MVTRTTQGKKKINLQIAGMMCAACVEHNEEALKELPGIDKAVVNLALGKASVEYDPSRVTLNDMKKAVADAGYEVVLDTVRFKITGMTCASCVANNEKAIGDLPGVSKVVTWEPSA